MKERPILFSAPMVRALLEGSKTQTRRVIKKATGLSLSVGQEDEQPDVAVLSWLTGAGPGYDVDEHVERVRSPYGALGDRLWVKESFWGCDMPGYGDQPCVVYDDEWVGKEYHPAIARPWGRKFGRIPSIHMPRESSRITLEIIGIRVERVHDISEEDAQAEGVESPEAECEDHDWKICPRCGGTRLYTDFDPRSGGACPDTDCMECDTHAKRFRHLWTAINGEESWGANPWVWVVDFKRISP